MLICDIRKSRGFFGSRTRSLLIVAVATIASISSGMRSAAHPAELLTSDDVQSPAENSEAVEGTANTVVVTPKKCDEIRLNPGKGWVLYEEPDAFDPSILSIGAIGYSRFNWCEIEPKEGSYNWKPIDRKIASWALKGKPFAFGVMSANTSSSQSYVTPHWVFDLGAKSYLATGPADVHIDPSKRVPQYIPDWNDPMYLRASVDFAEALGKRYDGNTHLAFVDIRCYGNWGEGHLHRINGERITEEHLNTLIDAYRASFKQTLLMLPWGEHFYDDAYSRAVRAGIGLRRDGIVGNSNGSEVTQCLGFAPSVFEFYDSYKNMKAAGWWDGHTSKGFGFKLQDCVDIGHPSYISLGSPTSAAALCKAEPQLVHALANEMGYDFNLIRVEHPASTPANKFVPVQLTVQNIGIAPLYRPASLRIGLISATGEVVDDQEIPTDQCDPRSWQPGKILPLKIVARFRKATPGKYQLALGLADEPAPMPLDYHWACSGCTPEGWFPAGKIQISAE